jgi:hypothetical protein
MCAKVADNLLGNHSNADTTPELEVYLVNRKRHPAVQSNSCILIMLGSHVVRGPFTHSDDLSCWCCRCSP